MSVVQRRPLLSAVPYCYLTWTSRSSQCSLRTLPPHANQSLMLTNESRWPLGNLEFTHSFFMRAIKAHWHTPALSIHTHVVKSSCIPCIPVAEWKQMNTNQANNNTETKQDVKYPQHRDYFNPTLVKNTTDKKWIKASVDR